MEKDFLNYFNAKDDLTIRKTIKKYYNFIVFENHFRVPIHFKLSDTNWLSANSLNLILIFIDSVLSQRPNETIYVDLFPKVTFDKILMSQKEVKGSYIRYCVNNEPIPDMLIKRYRSKLIFYETMEFTKILYDHQIQVFPGPNKLDKIKEHLQAFSFGKKWKYSSRMLSLNRLIETELEQRSLSDRVATMANILHKNLFGRRSLQESREDSEQIMFELVKNIYQHSSELDPEHHKNKGFACAQIIPKPLLNEPQIDIDKLKDLLYKEWKRVEKEWQFLSITINDFGVGLSNKIRSDLLNYKTNFVQKIGRFNIDTDFINDDWSLMLLAASTDYTTKHLDKRSEGDNNFLEKPLEGKGFGFIFCMAFIAMNYGRMELRSAASKILFIAKPEAYWKNFWRNSFDASQALQDNFDKYFIATRTDLTPEESSFPGTQVLIEIPVEVFL